MEIDRDTLKALSSEKKIAIMKSLSQRKKMPSEISRELGIAPSTAVEHLKSLEKSGIVKKNSTGHKWVYYELTGKGAGIIKPKAPVQSIFILSLGIVLAVGSFFAYVFHAPFAIADYTETQIAAGAESAAREAAQKAAEAPADALLLPIILIFIAGILLIAYSMRRMKSRQTS